MKTYNQFLNTPFSEEVKPPEPPEPQEEDPSMKSRETRQKQIKKMVLLKKLQAVRAGAGADIVAGYEPEGEQLDETPKGDVGKDYETVQRRRNEDQNRRRGDKGSRLPDKAQELRRNEHKMRRGAKTGPLRSGKQPDKVSQDVSRLRRITDTFSSQSHRKEEFELDERLGGKGYKPYTDLRGKKVSGDWEDSDRGGGHKWKEKVGKPVKKKSPTYLAHVHNKKVKEEVVDEGIRKAIKKGVRLAKREASKMVVDDPGGMHTYGSLGNPKPGDKAKRDKERAAKKKVSEGTDKAFDFVKAKIEKEVGKSGYVSKDNPRKKQTDAEKAKVRAHQAKVDKENAAERKKDPSQGRYPKG